MTVSYCKLKALFNVLINLHITRISSWIPDIQNISGHGLLETNGHYKPVAWMRSKNSVKILLLSFTISPATADMGQKSRAATPTTRLPTLPTGKKIRESKPRLWKSQNIRPKSSRILQRMPRCCSWVGTGFCC